METGYHPVVCLLHNFFSFRRLKNKMEGVFLTITEIMTFLSLPGFNFRTFVPPVFMIHYTFMIYYTISFLL